MVAPIYADLLSETGPRMLVEALALYGEKEIAGGANSPVIMGWAAEVGVAAVYTADEIPWCGLFVAVCAKRAGWPVPAQPLWALNWSKWEADAGQPELGDVLVFAGRGRRHVGLYVGEDREAYHVLGGNQSNAVTITRIGKKRFFAARRPEWKIAEPLSRRPIVRTAQGALSENEA